MTTTERRRPVRVSKQNPCPICGKTDWCMVGDSYILCMKVQSERPKELADGNVGWLHPLGSTPSPRTDREERPVPILNVNQKLSEWGRDSGWRSTIPLSVKLGVSNRSLEMLNCIHAPYHETWAFPMRTGDGCYCGIRLRKENGEKWAERGSHQGLFIPQTEPAATVLIVEGPTDCAAALTVGYFAIGRPNCCGGIEHLKLALTRLKIRRAVIVSDLDDPGLRGASTLAEHLPIPTAILTCPAKDLRAFVNNGGDREMMDAIIRTLVWKQGMND